MSIANLKKEQEGTEGSLGPLYCIKRDIQPPPIPQNEHHELATSEKNNDEAPIDDLEREKKPNTDFYDPSTSPRCYAR